MTVGRGTIVASIIAIVLAVSSVLLYSRVSILESMYEAKYIECENLRSSYTSILSGYESLISDYRKLNSSYTTLSSLYKALLSDYQKLLYDYQNLSLDNERLAVTIDSLNRSYRILCDEYNVVMSKLLRLQDDYEGLNSVYNDLYGDYKFILERYTILRDSYDSLKAKLSTGAFETFVKDYLKLVDEVNIHATHPKKEDLLLITPNDIRVRSLMLQITGGWSGYLDLSEISRDVKALFDWVVNNVRYRSDGLYPLLPPDPSFPPSYVSDMWQYPNQTLAFREGDCDDQAILLASMLSAYFQGKLRVECIIVTDHMAVYIPFENGREMILDPAVGYYTGSPGMPSFKDVSVEVYRWIGRLEDMFGKRINVKWVFSDRFLKLFYSTERFIEWLYETTR
ncbi:MAG: hypothetical protein N3E44_06515 [Candidatus Bathyarchaeota archaeon]|nr:hypothetical protein [Candidatus Bathyarchaeota archaeon]